jgi:hypothetical protein
MKNRNLTDGRPLEGYVVEIGGKFNSEYGSITAALKAGLELKNRNSQSQVRVYEATAQMPAELSGRSEENSDRDK